MNAIKVTYRRLAELCESSPGITFATTDNRVITWVGHYRYPSGRRNLQNYNVKMQDGWGYWIDKKDFDSTVEIQD